jgi:predicted RNase H-like HicB family nuclease
MIRKEKIKKTVVCYWSAMDETFVAESAMMPHVVIGVGETPDEALRNFDTTLDTVYDDITSDNVAGYKLGRPAKGYVPLNVNIRSSSRSRILELAKELEISQGEAFDYLVFFFECKIQEHAHVPDKDELVRALEQFKEQQIQLVEKIDHITRVSESS